MTIAHPAGFQIIAVPAANEAARKPGLLQRAFDTLFAARERDAQRNVDAYIARRGYRLTDSVEREISDRMLDGQWMTRR